MGAVAVISKNGVRLMPTNSVRARWLLTTSKAVIESYRPVFTIRLTERTDGSVQPVELKCDAGYQHIGISVASEKREFINEQRDLLADEKNRHQDSRKYRRARRNRLRHRKPRFNNRKGKISKDGFAPSIRNKRDVHVRLISQYAKVIPITDVYVEVGQFDTQVLKAIEEGIPIPEGKDYQQGEQYGYNTLREAVFCRDDYKCVVCGRSAFADGIILRIHHLGYAQGDRTNRMSNLASVCTKCHTAKNHKPGGKLYDLKPRLKPFAGATFMTAVRYSLVNELKATLGNVNIHITFGAATKTARKELCIGKTHANDAYCMGTLHPKIRAEFQCWQKKRRNNRILEKFYDAKYIDSRTGEVKLGSQLSCGRTNRSESRNGEKNERIYRCGKVSKGRRSVRRQRYPIQPGDIVLYGRKKAQTAGSHSKGTQLLINGKSVSVKRITLVCHQNGWQKQNKYERSAISSHG